MGDAETKLQPQTVVQDVRVSSPGVCRIMTDPTPLNFNQIPDNNIGRDFYKQRYDKAFADRKEMSGKGYPRVEKSMDYTPTPVYPELGKGSGQHPHEVPLDLATGRNFDFPRSLYEGRFPPPYPPGTAPPPFLTNKGKLGQIDEHRSGTSAIESLVHDVFTDGHHGCNENSRYSSSSLSSPSHSLGTPTSPDVPMMGGSMGRGDSPRSNATLSPPSSYATSPKLLSQPQMDTGSSSPYRMVREREKRPVSETEGSPDDRPWDNGGVPPKKPHNCNEPPVPSIKEEVDDSLPVMQPQIHSQHESQHLISMSSDVAHPTVDRRKNSGGETLVRHCQICNDVASGFHYGVWSCEGCKAFFKRSIQGPVDYVCPATNTCTIDKHRRKSCQACRLRKCLEMGMTKGSNSRKERGSGGPRITQRNSQKKRTSQENHINSSSEEQKEVKIKREITDPLVAILVKADPPVLNSQHNEGIPDSDFHIMSSLMKLADKELVYMINWAKQIPGYTELSLNDQVHLLESSWLELLTIGCAHRSMKYKGDKLEFAPDLVLDKSRCQIAGVAEVCELVSAIACKFSELKLTHEEFVIMKAMALVNAEAVPLTSMEKILVMQRQLMDALHHVQSVRYPHDSVRIQELLLLMPHIRQVSLRGIAHMFDFKNEAAVPLCDLLLELLDSQQVVMRHGKDNHSQDGEDKQGPENDPGQGTSRSEESAQGTAPPT